MKAAAFDYERPADLRQAVHLLASHDGEAKVIAGGQSLGPMLNLRLATPQILVDVSRIAELQRAENNSDDVVLGACVTHAAVEDRRVPDATRGIMPRIARGIAYRAVRNRGTLGGSLAHADPAADWLVCLSALGAQAIVRGSRSDRSIAVSQLMVGPFETGLAADELVEAVRVPKLSPHARWGFCKVARKAGKFADAMAAVLIDPERDVRCAVMGAMDARPVLIEDARWLIDRRAGLFDDGVPDASIVESLRELGLRGDRYTVRIHLVALQRALDQVRMP